MRDRLADHGVGDGVPQFVRPIPDRRHRPDGVVCNFRGVRGTEPTTCWWRALGADAKFATLALKKVPADYVHKAIKQLVDATRRSGSTARRRSGSLSRGTPGAVGPVADDTGNGGSGVRARP